MPEGTAAVPLIMEHPNYFDVRRFRKEAPGRFIGYPITTDRVGTICSRLLPQCQRVLDVGAGRWPFLPELKARGFAGIFKTMDIDVSLPFDFYSMEEIAENFDAILLRDVIEHLPRPQFYSYLEKIHTLLNPKGLLVITTPNTWAPSWVFSDYTHISPWAPADLYAVLSCYGFRPVEITRAVWPSKFLALKRLYWSIHSRFYDIDFADTCIAIAQKPSR